MIPVDFLGVERGLAIHLEGEDLVEFALGRKRQAHRFSQHVGLAQPKYRGPADAAGQLRQADRAEGEMSEGDLFAVSAQVRSYGFNPAAQLPDRGDYQCIASTKRRAPQLPR